MESWVIFAIGVIAGIFMTALMVVASNASDLKNDETKGSGVILTLPGKNDLISRQDLINYLKLYNYDDSDMIKVKYIRQFLDRN